jgi:hypothetical protein
MTQYGCASFIPTLAGINMTITRSVANASSALLLLSIGFAGPVQAENLRCGNKLVSPGQTRLEVRAKCGEPGDVVQSTIVRSAEYARRDGLRRAFYSVEESVVVSVEDWTYNLGPHRLMCRLRFVNGVLETVQTLSYGFNE